MLDYLFSQGIYRPEFLNRVDEVIVFRSLGKEQIRSIVDIMLRTVCDRLREKHIALDVSDAAKEFLIEKGFSPTFGARPLRRAIQKHVEDALAEELLRGKIAEGAKVHLDAGPDGTLVFAPQPPQAALV
ncbi:MAG: ATP-dependent Clp protease ATP-binding subunit ClpC, partial [bacterium]